MEFPVKRLLLVSVMAAMLAACGGDGETSSSDTPTPPADPLASYRAQTLDWRECDDTLQETARDDGLDLARLSCAQMQVPADYADVSKGDLKIELVRVRALAPDAQTLVVNPGGPGESGLSLAVDLASVWSDASADNEVGRQMQAIAQMYDVVSFAPRGVAGSTALSCRLGGPWPTPSDAPAGYDETVFQQQVERGRLQAEACMTQWFAPYINTAMTVEDMALLRQLLGAEKLNYLGYSYGTWLGLWYASAYPEATGRMVVDSSMNFLSTMYEEFATIGPALSRLNEEVLFPLAASRPAEFGLGTDTSVMSSFFVDLSPQVQDMFLSLRQQGHGSPQDMINSLYFLAAARELDVMLETQSPDEVLEDIDTHIFPNVAGDDNMARMRLAAKLLLAELGEEEDDEEDDKAVRMQSDSDDVAWDESGSLPTNLAVRCADTPMPSQDPRYFQQRSLQNIALKHPVDTDQSYLCLFWDGVAAAPKPALAQANSVPVLFVQAQYDLQTPEPGALLSFEALPLASLVYVPREIKHALYPYRDACVDLHVSTYLVTGETSARTMSCASKVEHLLAPTPAMARRGASAAMASESAEAMWMAQTFQNPARTDAIIDRMPRGTR